MTEQWIKPKMRRGKRTSTKMFVTLNKHIATLSTAFGAALRTAVPDAARFYVRVNASNTKIGIFVVGEDSRAGSQIREGNSFSVSLKTQMLLHGLSYGRHDVRVATEEEAPAHFIIDIPKRSSDE